VDVLLIQHALQQLFKLLVSPIHQEQHAFGIQHAKKRYAEMLQLQTTHIHYAQLTYQHAQSMLQVMDVQIEHVQMLQLPLFQILIVKHIYQVVNVSQRAVVDVLLIQLVLQ
jgi:hypothetical protein